MENSAGLSNFANVGEFECGTTNVDYSYVV